MDALNHWARTLTPWEFWFYYGLFVIAVMGIFLWNARKLEKIFNGIRTAPSKPINKLGQEGQHNTGRLKTFLINWLITALVSFFFLVTTMVVTHDFGSSAKQMQVYLWYYLVAASLPAIWRTKRPTFGHMLISVTIGTTTAIAASVVLGVAALFPSASNSVLLGVLILFLGGPIAVITGILSSNYFLKKMESRR